MAVVQAKPVVGDLVQARPVLVDSAEQRVVFLSGVVNESAWD